MKRTPTSAQKQDTRRRDREYLNGLILELQREKTEHQQLIHGIDAAIDVYARCLARMGRR